MEQQVVVFPVWVVQLKISDPGCFMLLVLLTLTLTLAPNPYHTKINNTTVVVLLILVW